jgi:hypothetical protein
MEKESKKKKKNVEIDTEPSIEDTKSVSEAKEAYTDYKVTYIKAINDPKYKYAKKLVSFDLTLPGEKNPTTPERVRHLLAKHPKAKKLKADGWKFLEVGHNDRETYYTQPAKIIKEEKMTDTEMKKREDIVKAMKEKTSNFKAKYGDKAKEVMYATATKMAMKEGVELTGNDLDEMNLSELSKKTLGSYVKKASRDRFAQGVEAGAARQDSPEQKNTIKKAKKRREGIDLAVDRLTKEETELDEARAPKTVSNKVEDAINSLQEVKTKLTAANNKHASRSIKMKLKRYTTTVSDMIFDLNKELKDMRGSLRTMTEEFDLDEAAYDQDVDPNKKIKVSGLKGKNSKPFTKKFRNMAAYDKWADSDAADDYQVQEVMNEEETKVKSKLSAFLEARRGRPRKNAGDESGEEEEKENLIMQLRKSISLRGQKDVIFDDGKKLKVTPNAAHAAIGAINSEKMPAKKQELLKKMAASPEAFMELVKQIRGN